ncbi:hypothetical protein RIF29_28755 [Crotalaria pallida]|uniref:Uncharacterized protein n=1 Tax=Crotalaria pallida TaxID=3830 RepID=A0AAN9ED84_CROPI
MMPASVREDNGGTLPPMGPEAALPPNQSGWKQRIRPTQYTIANNMQNLPRRFVTTCLNTELDTITLRGKKGNGDAVEKVCALYIHAGNHRIMNQWRDFCQEMDIQAGYGLLLEVVNGAQNIVTVEIEDDGDDEWEEEE